MVKYYFLTISRVELEQQVGEEKRLGLWGKQGQLSLAWTIVRQ